MTPRGFHRPRIAGGAMAAARNIADLLPQDAMPRDRRPPLHSLELQALKKLLGTDRETIEQAADEEGVSLEAYVKKLLTDHAKDLRG